MSEADDSEQDDADEDGLAVTALLRTLDLRRGVRPQARLLLRPLSATPPLVPPDCLPNLPSLVRDAAGRPRLWQLEPNTDLALCGCGAELVDGGAAALRDLSVSGSPTCLARSRSSVEPVGRSTLGAGALGADGVLRVSYLHSGDGDDEVDDAGCGLDGGGRGVDVGGPRLPRELRSSALVQYAERVDVIAPADNMKAFFKLLHTESAISLAVHRVGNTLVLEGLELDRSSMGGAPTDGAKRRGAGGRAKGGGNAGGESGADRPTGGGEADPNCEEDGGRGAGGTRQGVVGGGGRLQLARKALHSRFLTYSLALEPHSPVADGRYSSGRATGKRAGVEVGRGGEREGGGEGGGEEERGGDGGGAWEGAGGAGGAIGSGSCGSGSSLADGSGESDDSDCSDAEEWMPSKRPPHGFLRTLRWQLGDLNVLLGSDTLVFREGAAAGGVARLDTSRSADGYASSGVSVALHDTRSDVTSLVCLDYWLDAVMSSASEVAICLHNGGVVQGYRAVPTQDLPGGGGLSADGGFSPSVVTSCAVSVLRFLRSNCTREAGTYWLVRRAGGDELELYDISEVGTDAPHGRKAGEGAKTGAAAGVRAGAKAGAGAGKRAGAAGAYAATGVSGDNGSDFDPGSVSPVECSDADSEADDSLGLETSPPAGRGSHASFHPFAEPVALLCWRIAERLSPTVPDEAKRRRTLLESCVSLLNTETGTGARQQLPMVAAAQEGLADGWLLEAHQLMPLPPVGAPPVAGANRTPIRGFDPARRLQVAGSGLPSPCPPCDEALAAVAAQRNAARALLGGVRALREVCRPGAAPPRLLRMLAKLARTETALARRYTLVGRPGRAVAALRRAAAAQAALRTPVGSLSSLPGIAKPPAAAGGAVRAAERGHMLLTLADACALVARAAAGPDAAAARAEVAMHAEELRVALQEPELTLPSWAGGGAGVANAGVGGAGMTGEVVVGVGSGSGFPSGGSAQEASQPFPTGSGSPSASPPPALHRSPSGGWPAAASPLAPEPSLAYPNSEPPAVPTISAFAPDAEGNWKLAIGFYLSAVRTIPSASLAAAHARLRDAYTSLGQLYVSADRFTKACRHYQQGIELFRSTADPRSAAVMAVAFARALRSRLGAAPPVGSAGIPPAALLPAAAARLAMAAGGGTPPPAEMAQAELHDFERCAALLEQAKALLGGEGEGVPPRVGTPPAGADGALWAEAELELGATQLMQAARLDESLPYAPHRAEAIAAVTALLVSAAARLEAGGEPALAGDARYRLGLLMRGEAERAAAGRGANPASGAAVALASLVCAKDHFEAAQRLLPPAARPAEHVLVRCDTAAVHRALALPPCTAPNAPTPARHAELHAALAQLLATHDVFGLYAFPLPPPSPTAKAHGGPAAPSEPAAPDLAADGTAKVPPDTASPAPAAKLANGAAPQREAEAGDPPPRPVLPPVSVSGGACALVAATWPVVEAEVQAVLKELVKLHAGAGATASASKYKRLYRLSLTQRELLGTSILLQIAEEVGAQPAE